MGPVEDVVLWLLRQNQPCVECFGRPVDFEVHVWREIADDVVQVDHRNRIAGEELNLGALHQAAEPQVCEVPTAQRVQLQLRVLRLIIEIEHRHQLLAVAHCVRNNELAVEANESAGVVERAGLVELLAAHVEELLELLRFAEPHDEIICSEIYFVEFLIAVLVVDFIHQSRLDVGDVKALHARAVVEILMQLVEVCVKELLFHNTHGAILLCLSNDVWKINFVKCFPPEVSFAAVVTLRMIAMGFISICCHPRQRFCLFSLTMLKKLIKNIFSARIGF